MSLSQNQRNTIELIWNTQKLIFKEVDLNFIKRDIEDIFAGKNNKTLNDTLKTKKYNKFQDTVNSKYSALLTCELGKFMFCLKKKGDNFYLCFLNKYGDKQYCEFSIIDNNYFNKKGLYIYCVNNELKYIGRCTDSFNTRINQGYGKIHPKNCYLDGQTTNCRLNYLIGQNQSNIKFLVYIMTDNKIIIQAEKDLIKQYKPPWNL